MNDIESDILIAEPEEEIEEAQNSFEEAQVDNLFGTQISADNLFEPQKVESENKTLKKETDAFVNYNFNNLNKVYKKFDVVETYVPKKENKKKQNREFESFVNEQDSYVPEKETISVERVKEKPKFQLKQKAKAWLVSILVIISMLGGLAIYNAVSIANLNKDINQTEISISNVKKEIDAVIKNTNELTDEDNILDRADELGLEQATDAEKITITLNEKNEIEEYQSQTNFFDRICNFFRNLFGG